MRNFFLGLACLPLVACGGSGMAMAGQEVQAQGSGGTRTYAARDFNAVDLRGADDVQVTTGGEFSVRAEGDSAVLDRLDIRIDGDTLKIGRKKGDWGRSSGSAKVYVSMPEIRAGSLAGAADLTINRVANDFDGSLAGSGDFTIGVLQGGRGNFSLAGSGTIAATGQLDRFDLSIAGSGSFNAPQLTANTANINIAGSGDTVARVNGDASINIMGSGDVDLGPNARCKTSKMGSGSIRCGTDSRG